MKNKLLPKIMTLFLTISMFNNKGSAQTPPCPSKFWSHVDCVFELKRIGYSIDTVTTTTANKQHFHDLSEFSLNSCWDIDADSINVMFGCTVCGYSDPSIINYFNFPNGSKIYKYFTIANGTSLGHLVYDWYDIIRYNDTHKGSIYIPSAPYCCSSNPPEACQTCNCGVGDVNWEISRFGLIPARGQEWHGSCLSSL